MREEKRIRKEKKILTEEEGTLEAVDGRRRQKVWVALTEEGFHEEDDNTKNLQKRLSKHSLHPSC